MASERIQRQIDRLLDEIDSAAAERSWATVRDLAQHVLTFDPVNAEARAFLAAAERGVSTPAQPPNSPTEVVVSPAHTSFANGRYEVKRLIGEGGKKRVYLAHDTLLDRDVAFALIKTDGLDDAGRQRIRREAQAMGRLGDHPHIVTVFDIGDEQQQPYLVSQLMIGGDVASRLSEATEHRLSVDSAITIARQVCQALAHAHAQHVIHRDLKPGNIWLAADGTAKLGDFGLAVALDQTRHTQPGMMVGTVAYMAPEQAIGGVVDARADLYALGCVLYELVCGRPPFIGEESVAIITQHLNTPPVHPIWHRPDCPAGLEALTLRLLEKDPEKRPASATEVAQALASITLAADARILDGASVSVIPDATATSLYQQTFVGREAELRQLQSAYDATLSGQGSLAMVVGEPGIGKTTLCEQLATYATVRGGATLVGHCYEEGSLSLPYLAFVEALRSYVLSREPETLKEALGSGAGDVARIVSEVRERVAIEPRSPGGDPEEDRWRLLEAVTGFLHNASGLQPLVVILEDLHWADRGTLDLLQHVARNLGGTRLLIVGTYRDVEVDRSHPLSSALADLRRSSAFLRIGLRGLSVDEVHRMMNQLRGQEVPWSRAEAIHRQTEGNPLFVQEVLRYLVEEGLVVREGGLWVRTDGSDPEAGIPEGLRDVIGKRLSRLSEATNQVLTVASVIGRDFRLDALQAVANLPEETVIGALEEAQSRAVIEERYASGGPGSGLAFRFTHAFFRQTLYEEIFTARRIRWHQQVGRALEQVYGRRVEEHAAELAEHFANSTDADDLTRAVLYGQMAARRALAVYAHGEAVRHLERALEAQEVLDPDDQAARCDLLLMLSEALSPAGEAERVFTAVANEAYTLAVALADDTRACRACRAAIFAMRQFGGTTASGSNSDGFRRWVEQLDHHARPGTADRVRADMSLSAGLRNTGQTAASWDKAVEALQAARQLGDPDQLLETASWLALGGTTPVGELGLQRESAEELLQMDFDNAGRQALLLGVSGVPNTLLIWGERDRAQQAWDRLAAQTERQRDPEMRSVVLLGQAIFATWDGDLERALELADAIVTHGQHTGSEAGARGYAGRARRRALLYLGRAEEVLASIPSLPALWAVGGALAAQRAVYLAHAGQTDAARGILNQFLAEHDFAAPDDRPAATLVRFLLDAAVVAGHRQAAVIFEPLAAPMTDLLFSEAYLTNCVGRDLGGAARLLGQPEKARGYYERGIAACLKGRHRPELALCRLELAELLLDEYPEERAEALENLDFAISELQAMRMQTFLERALRRKLQLQGVDAVSPSTSIDAVAIAVGSERPNLQPHAAPDGTVTLLFTDIEGSTGLTIRLGDQRWLEILRAHHALIRQQVHAHGGFEVKNQGDGFMLAFGSARRALECAVAIQRAVEADNSTRPESPIRVRIGLHTGEALKEADDFHGRHVVLAARIANQAQGGEILVSSLLRELTESSGDFGFDAGQEVELKGLAGVQRVHRLVWA